MEVAIKINGTKEISLNPETPLEQEYLPLMNHLGWPMFLPQTYKTDSYCYHKTYQSKK